MSDEMNEATRVMGAVTPPPGSDKTMVAGAPAFDRTMVAGGVAGATQMGASVQCPVCRTSNSTFETYCGDCGFLLNSSPGATEEAAPDTGVSIELVENTTNRRFKLKSGQNIVGRENCDILLMEGTVSRRHAIVNLEGAVVTVTDLGSTNGTKVDGARLSPNQPTPLSTGGTVQFGNCVLTMVGGAPAEATIVAGAVTQVTIGEPPSALEERTIIDGDTVTAAPEPEISFAESAVQPAAVSTSAKPIAILRSSSGTANIEVFVGAQTVGRKSTNDVVISTDPYVSGSHALVNCNEDGVLVIDIGSTNGTTVNGQRLLPNTPQSLMNGDVVAFGKSEYTFEVVMAEMPFAQLDESAEHKSEPESGEATA